VKVAMRVVVKIGRLTPRWIGRVDDKVLRPTRRARAAQLNR
jgi:hypothetical protein